MRTLFIASAGMALVVGGTADAQQRIVTPGPGAGYGVPAMRAPAPTRPVPVIQSVPHRAGGWQQPNRPTSGWQQPRAARWGSKVGGRWWGGANAPGGWNGYRQPHRGWALPRYWVAPRFFIDDWSGYGLAQPPVGYNWTRYYDDAVLIDSRGSVYDSVGGLDWDRFDGPGGYTVDARPPVGDDYAYDDRAYDDRAYDDRGPPPRRDGGRRSDGRRSNGLGSDGVGGAAVGAVVGGVAGNVIAGRGNRLGGTLIGAGVGAAAGYAIDRNADRGRRGPPPAAYGYGAGYPQPGYGGPIHGAGPGGWVSPDGRTTVTTTNGGYYGGGSSTTVVVQSAPVVTTTTTTEYIEDRVTYSRPRAWKKRAWKRPRCKC